MFPGFPAVAILSRRTDSTRNRRVVLSGAADRILLADLASSNLSPGLKEGEFQATIRSLLTTIPIAEGPFLKHLKTRRLPVPTRARTLRQSLAMNFLPTTYGRHL